MDYQSLKNKLDKCTNTQSTLEAIKGVFQLDAEYRIFRAEQERQKGNPEQVRKYQLKYVSACDAWEIIDDFQKKNLEKYRRAIDFIEKRMTEGGHE